MTDWIVDPANNIELKLDYLRFIMPVSMSTVLKYTPNASSSPTVSRGSPHPFQFELSAEILASFEDTKRKVSYFDKQQIAALMALGSKQEAARMLKISRSKLWRKMRLYKISDRDFKK